MSTVFVSHSSKDRKVAVRICAALEAKGIACWLSSRDINPGENFGEAIVTAIRAAKLMLLIFTANANNSDEIKKELVLAGHHKVTVIPVRVEDVVPGGAFAYELATRQWIDLFDDWDREMDRLAAWIQRTLSIHDEVERVPRDVPLHAVEAHVADTIEPDGAAAPRSQPATPQPTDMVDAPPAPPVAPPPVRPLRSVERLPASAARPTGRTASIPPGLAPRDAASVEASSDAPAKRTTSRPFRPDILLAWLLAGVASIHALFMVMLVHAYPNIAPGNRLIYQALIVLLCSIEIGFAIVVPREVAGPRHAARVFGAVCIGVEALASLWGLLGLFVIATGGAVWHEAENNIFNIATMVSVPALVFMVLIYRIRLRSAARPGVG